MGKKSSWSIILNHLQHMAAHYHVTVLLALGYQGVFQEWILSEEKKDGSALTQ